MNYELITNTLKVTDAEIATLAGLDGSRCVQGLNSCLSPNYIISLREIEINRKSE